MEDKTYDVLLKIKKTKSDLMEARLNEFLAYDKKPMIINRKNEMSMTES